MTRIVLTAAFGGAFPNLITLALSLTGAHSEPLPDASYLAGVLLFALMGVAIALIWGEDDLKKVFYLGIGLPSLIQANAGALSTHQDSLSSMIRSIGVGSAFAQAPVSAASGRAITIAAPEQARDLTVVFSSGDGSRKEQVRVAPSNATTVVVPSYASSFQVQLDGSRSQAETLPAEVGFHKRFTVEVGRTSWDGFYRSLGIKSSNPYRLDVRGE